MRKIKVVLHLTKRELFTIKDIDVTPTAYIQSIVHYGLQKICRPEVVDNIPWERSPDRNLF